MFSESDCEHLVILSDHSLITNNIYYISLTPPQLIFLLSGEACWWTVHPASKQRSEGEKVRVGDDVIFVSVATERYLVGCHAV